MGYLDQKVEQKLAGVKDQALADAREELAADASALEEKAAAMRAELEATAPEVLPEVVAEG